MNRSARVLVCSSGAGWRRLAAQKAPTPQLGCGRIKPIALNVARRLCASFCFELPNVAVAARKILKIADQMVGAIGIEPMTLPCEGNALPLSYYIPLRKSFDLNWLAILPPYRWRFNIGEFPRPLWHRCGRQDDSAKQS